MPTIEQLLQTPRSQWSMEDQAEYEKYIYHTVRPRIDDQVRIVWMSEQYHSLEPGMIGTIKSLDDETIDIDIPNLPRSTLYWYEVEPYVALHKEQTPIERALRKMIAS